VCIRKIRVQYGSICKNFSLSNDSESKELSLTHMWTMFKLYNVSSQLILLLVFASTLAACGSATVEPTASPTVAAQPATATVAPTETAAPTVTVTATQAPTTTVQSQSNKILDVVARAKGLENFVTLLENAGLTDKLQSQAPMTLFLVPNTAWQELPPAVLNNEDLMRQILLNHLVEGSQLMTAMASAGKVQSLNGDELEVLVGQEGGTIQGANVLEADYQAEDGILHLLDTVILPRASITEVMALYPSVAGEQSYAMQGNIHIARGESSPVSYNSIPPTSGPHYSDIVAWQLYEQNFPYEQLVHNLEDGGVILYYQCSAACPELVEQLRTVVQPYFDAGRHVLIAPNDPTWTPTAGVTPHQEMGAPIAVVAWRKLLMLNEVDAEKIRQFIEAYEGIDHHAK
jgi:uncharacterized surface protein with fasciclin (FAS1) repeats